MRLLLRSVRSIRVFIILLLLRYLAVDSLACSRGSLVQLDVVELNLPDV